jgi:hypothetical protein
MPAGQILFHAKMSLKGDSAYCSIGGRGDLVMDRSELQAKRIVQTVVDDPAPREHLVQQVKLALLNQAPLPGTRQRDAGVDPYDARCGKKVRNPWSQSGRR